MWAGHILPWAQLRTEEFKGNRTGDKESSSSKEYVELWQIFPQPLWPEQDPNRHQTTEFCIHGHHDRDVFITLSEDLIGLDMPYHHS